jgi:hypothetical protein
LTIFDGVDWEREREFDFDVDGFPYSVFGPSAEDLVIFTHPSQPGGVHFDGTQLTTISIPEFGVLGTIQNGDGVMGTAGDAEHGYFAVGYWKKSPDVLTSGFVWRSDDLQIWEEMEDVPHVDSNIYGETFWDVCVNNQGVVYVVGHRNDLATTPEGEDNPLVFSYDGNEWVDEDLPPIPDAQPGYEKCGSLKGVWCHGEHVFAVGTTFPDGTPDMAVLHYTPPEDP